MKSPADGLLEETTNDFFKKERKLNTQLRMGCGQKGFVGGWVLGGKGRREEDRREEVLAAEKIVKFLRGQGPGREAQGSLSVSHQKRRPLAGWLAG